MSKKSYKKYFNATLAATVAATGAAAVVPNQAEASTSFSDVPATYNFYKEITNLSERGIIKGFEDGTFRPGANVTRGQAAKIIAGALGLDTKNVKNPGFDDIPTTHQYYGAIAALANAGIISGYEDDTYRPGQPVQRNHMAKIISGAFNLEASSGYTTQLTDVRSDYAKYINALHEYGVTTGKTETTFDGSSNVTRGQLAAFVVRAENLEKTENQVTFTINSVETSKVQTSEGELKFATALQSVFSSKNATALTNAEVKAVVVDGEIKSISSLTLDAAGTEEALVIFDGANSTIESNITVNADFVSLNNVTVKGNVTVTEKVVNQFATDGLKVDGELVINEASKTPVAVASINGFVADVEGNLSLNLKNSTINSLNVKREKLAISGQGTINKLSVNATGLKVDLEGKITELNVQDKNASIELGQNVEVTKVIVPNGSKAADVISNYSSVKGKIGKVETSQGVTVENSTSGGGGGSSRDRDSNNGSNITGTEITTAGTYGPTSGNQTIQGDLTISSADVTLRNVTVTGKLILGEGIGEGDVHLQGVNVQGETIVNGGGQNSVYFTDSVLATVIVNKNTGAVRIVAQGNTQVVEVQLETPTIVVEDDLEGNSTGFEDIVVSEAMQTNGEGYQVQLEGSFETINSRATNVRINLSQETSIETVVLNAAAQVLGAGVIRTARINANGSSIAQSPYNVVLDIDGIGSVRVGDQEVTESYSDPDATTSITSVQAAQGSISLEMENFVADLTVDDFIVTAKVDGQDVSLNGLQYNKNRERFTFDPISLEHSGKTVEITVAPNSNKVTGEAKTSSFEVSTGFGGRITDIQGVGIPNLTIQFREGVGAREGEVVATAVTDEYGFYTVNVAPGSYTGEFTSPGYLTTYVLGSASSETFNLHYNETAMRAAASNEVKIMLTWDLNPRDLDSHLVGPEANGGQFHVYYGDKKEIENGRTYVDLDWDDVTSYGPETTTIRDLVDGEYRFFVHHFSGESTLSNSNAEVNVFIGNSTTANHTFNVPTGEGNERYWIVFDIFVSDNGETINIVPVNTMTNYVDYEDDNYYEVPGILVNESEPNLFDGKIFLSTGDTVSLTANEGTDIYYSLNGYIDYENPTSNTFYTVPFTIEENTVLHVAAVRDEELVGRNQFILVLGTPLETAIEIANNLIVQIPSVEEITSNNRYEVASIVSSAEKAIEDAKDFGAQDSDFVSLGKIAAAKEKFAELDSTPEQPGTGEDTDTDMSDTVSVETSGDTLTLTFSQEILEDLELNSIDTVSVATTSGDSVIISTSDSVSVTTSDTISVTIDLDLLENLTNEQYEFVLSSNGTTVGTIRRQGDTWKIVTE